MPANHAFSTECCKDESEGYQRENSGEIAEIQGKRAVNPARISNESYSCESQYSFVGSDNVLPEIVKDNFNIDLRIACCKKLHAEVKSRRTETRIREQIEDAPNEFKQVLEDSCSESRVTTQRLCIQLQAVISRTSSKV
jgi:hypothetical protein